MVIIDLLTMRRSMTDHNQKLLPHIHLWLGWSWQNGALKQHRNQPVIPLEMMRD